MCRGSGDVWSLPSAKDDLRGLPLLVVGVHDRISFSGKENSSRIFSAISATMP